jgi:hypothetical protein
MTMNHFIVSAFLALITTLAVGVYFVIKGTRDNRIFGIYWLSIALWSLFVSAQFQFLDWMPSFVWGWFLHLGCIFVPAFFFHFAVSISGRTNLRLPLRVSYLTASIFVFLNTFTSVFTNTISYRDAYAYPKPAMLYPLYFIFFVGVVAWGTVLLIQRRKSLDVSERKYLNLFLLVHVLAYLGAMDNFLIMIDVRIFPLYPFGLYLVVPYAVLGSYAMTRLRRAGVPREL